MMSFKFFISYPNLFYLVTMDATESALFAVVSFIPFEKIIAISYLSPFMTIITLQTIFSPWLIIRASINNFNNPPYYTFSNIYNVARNIVCFSNTFEKDRSLTVKNCVFIFKCIFCNAFSVRINYKFF